MNSSTGDFAIRECHFQSIAQYKGRALREGSVIKDLPATQWFEVVFRGRERVGCCGVHKAKKFARLKGSWLDPTFRGMGAYAIMHRDRLEWIADNLDIERVEIITVGDPDHYVRVYGFEFIRKARSGGSVLSLSADCLASFLGRS